MEDRDTHYSVGPIDNIIFLLNASGETHRENTYQKQGTHSSGRNILGILWKSYHSALLVMKLNNDPIKKRLIIAILIMIKLITVEFIITGNNTVLEYALNGWVVETLGCFISFFFPGMKKQSERWNE